MIKYDFLTGNQQQLFLVLLSKYEQEGITDVRFMRQHLENHINYVNQNNRRRMTEEQKEYSRKRKSLQVQMDTAEREANSFGGAVEQLCPECGRLMILEVKGTREQPEFVFNCKFSASRAGLVSREGCNYSMYVGGAKEFEELTGTDFLQLLRTK